MTLPPQQSRSQRTLNNILSAAAELLEENTFEEMTINDVVSRAGCSVGAFYGRFKDKDALLHALDQRFIDSYIEAGLEWAAGGLRIDTPLGEVVHDLMRLLVRLHQDDLGLLRTLILRVRLYPDPRFRAQEARLNEVVPAITEIILAHRDEIAHPKPELAVPLGFIQVFLAMRETLAWPHIGSTMPVKGKAYAAEMAKMYLGYLGVRQ